MCHYPVANFNESAVKLLHLLTFQTAQGGGGRESLCSCLNGGVTRLRAPMYPTHILMVDIRVKSSWPSQILQALIVS